MKVTIVDTKTGKEKQVAPRFAQILSKMGRATYLTRDLMAAPVAPALVQSVVQADATEEPEEELDGVPKKRKYTRKAKPE